MIFHSYRAGWCALDSVSPASGTLIADFEGTLNAITFTCNVTEPELGVMGITQWSIQNFRGVTVRRTITVNLAPELFLISGDELTDTPGFLANNILIIQNFTSELDEVVLYCGTARNPQVANFTLRLYRKFKI